MSNPTTREKLLKEWRGTGMYKIIERDTAYSGGERTLHEDVGEFWLELLEQECALRDEEMRKGAERLKKRVSSRSFNQQLEDTSLAYNDGIDDVLAILLPATEGDKEK